MEHSVNVSKTLNRVHVCENHEKDNYKNFTKCNSDASMMVAEITANKNLIVALSTAQFKPKEKITAKKKASKSK
jgi:hypothetical protein